MAGGDIAQETHRAGELHQNVGMVILRIGVDELYERAAQQRDASRGRGRRRWDARYDDQAGGKDAPSRARRRNQEISNDHFTRGFSRGLKGALGVTTIQLCVLWQVAQS